MQGLLRSAARRLAKGPPCACGTTIAGRIPPSGLLPWLCLPEAAHAGPLLRGGRRISNTPTMGNSGSPQPPGSGTGGPESGTGGQGSAAANGPAPTKGEEAPIPPLRLLSFGGPANSNLEDPDVFFQQNEVLQKVPVDRLITPDASRPYLFPDLGRQIFRSSLLIPFIAHLRKWSSGGVFEKEGNVGIIRDLNSFGLKEMFPYQVDDLTEAIMQKDFEEAFDYAVKKFEDAYGKNVIDKFPELVAVRDLIKVLPLNQKKIVNNAAFLSRESTAILIQRIYDFLIKVVPCQQPGLRSTASNIYQGMPYCSQADLWIPTALQDIWFINWIGRYDMGWINSLSQMPSGLTRLPIRLVGPALVRFHRHGCCAHYLELNIQNIVNTLQDPVKKQSLLAIPLTKQDVRQHFEYNFSKFPSTSVDSFEQEGMGHVVNMDDLFHTPTWYS